MDTMRPAALLFAAVLGSLLEADTLHSRTLAAAARSKAARTAACSAASQPPPELTSASSSSWALVRAVYASCAHTLMEPLKR